MMSENRRWRRQIERKSRGGQGGFLKSVSPISVPARLWLEMTPATQPPLSRPLPSPFPARSQPRAARLPCLLFTSRGCDWSQRSGVSGDGLKWLPARTADFAPCGEPSLPTLMQVWETTVGSGRGDTRVMPAFLGNKRKRDLRNRFKMSIVKNVQLHFLLCINVLLRSGATVYYAKYHCKYFRSKKRSIFFLFFPLFILFFFTPF